MVDIVFKPVGVSENPVFIKFLDFRTLSRRLIIRFPI